MMTTTISYPAPTTDFCSIEDLDPGDFFLFDGELFIYTDEKHMVRISDGYVYEERPSGACLRLVDVEIKVKYK